MCLFVYHLLKMSSSSSQTNSVSSLSSLETLDSELFEQSCKFNFNKNHVMSVKNILVLSLFPFSSLNLYLLYHPLPHLNMYEGVKKTPLIQRFFLGEVDSLLLVLSKSSLSLNVLFSRPWITINLASTPFLFSLRFPW